MQETQVQSLGWGDSLEEGMATYSSILSWRIPWTEEPGRLQSMGHMELDTTEQLSLHFSQKYSKANYSEDIYFQWTYVDMFTIS